MNREFMLLQSIDENNSISQRQLAKQLEVSLGTVNAMISQLLKDGYVIAEHTQAKQSKYFLYIGRQRRKKKGLNMLLFAIALILFQKPDKK